MIKKIFLLFFSLIFVYAEYEEESCNLKDEWILYKYMKNDNDDVSYIWNGNCDYENNAIGKGKLEIFVNNKKYIELLRINSNNIDFCRNGSSILTCGLYVDNIEWSGTYSKNLNTMIAYQFRKDKFRVGEWIKYNPKEIQFFKGIIKDNLFFGKIKAINTDTKDITTLYGSYDMFSNTLEGNILIQNKNGYIATYFRDGELVRKDYNIPNYFYDIQMRILNTSKKIEKDIVTAKQIFSNSVKIFKNDIVINIPKRNDKRYKSKIEGSQGTGFLVSNDGYIITNYHVIKGFSNIKVILYNSQKYSASVIETDPTNDLAILKIEDNNLSYLKLNKEVFIGERIVVFGYPATNILGNNIKVTFGNINSLSGLQDDLRFIQIDAPIQPGNSGGPIVNYCGDVIGIATQKVSDYFFLKRQGQLPQNVNYGLKIKLVENISNFPFQHSCHYKLNRKHLINKVQKSVVMIIAY